MASVTIDICIPYIDTGCEWRRRAFDWTCLYWRACGFDVRIGGVIGESPVNRAMARNLAARGSTADVLVFADADTWVPAPQLREAIERAQNGRLVHTYTNHVKLSRSTTERVLATDGVFGALPGQKLLRQPLGVVAVSHELFDLFGGFDERFIGWGGEDRAFELACLTLAGPAERVSGESYHLWHPRSAEQGRTTPERRANIDLASRYKRAAGVRGRLGPIPPTADAKFDPAAMVALLSEEGGPLDACVRTF